MTPVLLFAVSGDVDEVSPPEWVRLETGYLTIYYHPGADLDRIESRLRQRATYFSADIPSEYADVEEKIRYQLDALFRRAQNILDMHPDMHLKIRIFGSREELNEEYIKIFSENTPEDIEDEKLKAFYVDKYKTIYASEDDISDSIMAHEMGHAIIDHYFAVIPPEKVRELLASYVDLHLAE
jgi:hypothetical protein